MLRLGAGTEWDSTEQTVASGAVLVEHLEGDSRRNASLQEHRLSQGRGPSAPEMVPGLQCHGKPPRPAGSAFVTAENGGAEVDPRSGPMG